MSEPRIAPGRRSDVGWLNWMIGVVVGRFSGTNPPNLFLTMGRQRKLFRGWLRFAGRLMPGGKLSRRETELVILRVAHLRGSEYEFDHHVRLGRKVGLDEGDIERVVRGPEQPGWSEREHVMLSAVDELHHDRDLSDTTWAALRSQFDAPRCVEFLMLVGHYEMLATFLTTLRVQPDESQ